MSVFEIVLLPKNRNKPLISLKREKPRLCGGTEASARSAAAVRCAEGRRKLRARATEQQGWGGCFLSLLGGREHKFLRPKPWLSGGGTRSPLSL